MRVPHFSKLWASNLVQFCCTYAQLLILQWLVTSLTESRTLIGLVSFIQGGVIFVTSPLSGVAVDRLARRNILVAGRLGLALVLCAVAALVATGGIEVAHVLVASVALGLLMSLMQPATQTYVFDVVGRESLQSAVSLNAAATGVGQTLGPLLGGALLGAAGFVVAYLSVAAGLVMAAGLLLLVPVPGVSGDGARETHWWADLEEGLVYVVQHRAVLLALIVCSMSIFNGALAAMRPIFARHVLEVGSTGYGVMAGAAGLGGLVSALFVATRPVARRPGLLIAASMLGFSVLIFLYAFAFSYEYILVVEFGTGVCGQLWMVATFTGIQMAVPEEMRGRVMGLVFMVVMLAPMGALFVGMLADFAGDQLAMGIFGAIPTLLLLGILAFGWRTLSEL
ncbi:MAG: MFS transporter [Deltaproteobacteria bacterium]|nr:MFS transporter [Deltaproteobacteria bacterium]MBW2419551.1 MFS transporter [Deltaproteobacteria bacterium]